MQNKVQNLLLGLKNEIKAVVDYDLNNDKLVIFNMTASNPELDEIDIDNTEEFSKYIFNKLDKAGSPVGIGKYNENRTIYQKSSLFDEGPNSRTIHLGIDLWTKGITPVYAPIDGIIHSFRNNNNFGDYGPTVILEHNIKGIRFYTLYGHLTNDSINNKKEGMSIQKGEQLAKIGLPPVNGDWPPHLHFQIISDMKGKKGDFPGVSNLSNREKNLKNCLDPNLILNINKLK